MKPVDCPVCNTPMRQIRRGATLKKHGPAYICPNDEAETTTDEHGHLHRSPDAIHPRGRRVWTYDDWAEGISS